MDNLPCEIYQMIFEYFDLAESISLRRVSKRFNNFVNHGFKIKELILNENLKKETWLYDGRPINFRNQISPFIFSNVSFLFRISKIRRLKINSPDKILYVNSMLINSFSLLEQLEIYKSPIVFDDDKLSLPKLRSFALKSKHPLFSLIIEAPNLETIYIQDACDIGNAIKFDHPTSIENLFVTNYHANLSIFKNLKSLEIRNATNFHRNVLEEFARLEKLSIYFEGAEQLNKDQMNLMNTLQSRKGLKLCYYLNGVLYDEDENPSDFKLDHFTAHNRIMVTFNCNKRSSFEFDSDFLCYNELIRWFSYKVIEEKFSKLVKIETICIFGKPNNQDQLIKLILNCPSLSNLHTSHSKLDQTFFNQLPSISCLKILVIKEDDLNLDFKFVLRMFNLTEFNVNQNINIEDLLERFIKIYYLLDGVEHSIYKSKRDCLLYYKTLESDNLPDLPHKNLENDLGKKLKEKSKEQSINELVLYFIKYFLIAIAIVSLIMFLFKILISFAKLSSPVLTIRYSSNIDFIGKKNNSIFINNSSLIKNQGGL